MADTPALRTYEIEFADGTVQRLSIPESWKVTYGPIQGATQNIVEKQGGGRVSSSSPKYVHMLAFRAWEKDTQQRVMLTNVIGFRDISIPTLVKAVRKFGQETWHTDDGGWVGSRAQQVEKQWINADDIHPDSMTSQPPGGTADEEFGSPRPKSIVTRSR